MLTCRIEIEGINNLRKASQGHCMVMLWHNRLVIITHILWRSAKDLYYSAVISNSRDGDILAAIANVWDHASVIRVAHNARHHAVRQIIKKLKEQTIILITPDGPKGPRYKVKKGAAFTAQATKAKVIPLTWSADRFWQIKSWDKLIIPKPFSRIKVVIGQENDINKDESLEETAKRLEKSLLKATEAASLAITKKKELWPQ